MIACLFFLVCRPTATWSCTAPFRLTPGARTSRPGPTACAGSPTRPRKARRRFTSASTTMAMCNCTYVFSPVCSPILRHRRCLVMLRNQIIIHSLGVCSRYDVTNKVLWHSNTVDKGALVASIMSEADSKRGTATPEVHFRRNITRDKPKTANKTTGKYTQLNRRQPIPATAAVSIAAIVISSSPLPPTFIFSLPDALSIQGVDALVASWHLPADVSAQLQAAAYAAQSQFSAVTFVIQPKPQAYMNKVVAGQVTCTRCARTRHLCFVWQYPIVFVVIC